MSSSYSAPYSAPTQRDSFVDTLLAQAGWLKALVRSLVHDTARVDDVCQATLLEAISRHPEHVRSLRPWLASVARHLAIRTERRERQRPEREARASRVGTAPSAAEVVGEVAMQQTVANVVMNLDEPYRSTILLRFWEDNRPGEIARRLGIPVETVRTRIRRGLAQLRRQLDTECGSRQAWFPVLLPLALGGKTAIPLTLAVIMTAKTISLLAVAALIAVVLNFALSSGPEVVPELETPTAADPSLQVSTSSELTGAVDAGLTRRQAIPSSRAEGEALDPAVAAALVGFSGRVVDSGRGPVPSCDVRVYRISVDGVLAPSLDLSDADTAIEHLVHRDTTTDGSGRFLLSGIWPRGTYILLAHKESEGRTMQLLELSPRPGELVDLGDVILTNLGVITGVVVDEAGAPVVGALVRGVDLPAPFFSMARLERFDPEGALLNRDPSLSLDVIQVPSSFRELYEHLPIARTHTDGTGRFRLVGAAVGDNVIMVTKSGYLPRVETGVRAKSSGEQSLGDLRLRKGVAITGTVVDAGGKPVPGAELFAGSTTETMPFDFAGALAPSDPVGHFEGEGFAPGNVTVAARRDSRHPWYVADPQSVEGNLVVTLPEVTDMELRVTSSADAEIQGVVVELLSGTLDEPTVIMRRMGMSEAIDLAGRIEWKSQADLTIADLSLGHYLVAVRAEGHATAYQGIELSSERKTLTFDLDPARIYRLEVVDSGGIAIPQAAVYAQPASQGRPTDVTPVNCGKTGRDGLLVIDRVQAEKIKVAVSHPAYGTVYTVAEHTEGPIQVVMQAPGSILGSLTEDGGAPEFGKWTVLLLGSPRNGEELLSMTPRFVPIAGDGSFEFGSLQPGYYEVFAHEARGNKGTISQLVSLVEAIDGAPAARAGVRVQAGQPTPTLLTVGDTSAPVSTRDGAVAGQITVNGEPGVGLEVTVADNGGNRIGEAKTGRGGRFMIEGLPFGDANLSVIRIAENGKRVRIHRRHHNVTTAVDNVEISISTGSLEGQLVTIDGFSVSGVRVTVWRLPDRDGAFLERSVTTDQSGNFAFEYLNRGEYFLRALDDSQGKSFAADQRQRVEAGSRVTGVELQLIPAMSVSGRVDLSGLNLTDPSTASLAFLIEKRLTPSVRILSLVGSTPILADGSFTMRGLAAGTYRINLETGADQQLDLAHKETVTLVDSDLVNLEIELVIRR